MTFHPGPCDRLANFSGSVPLFPLPDVVLFPGIMLPLHIFEPRYRAMVEDALEGERLIAMSLLRPGWESCIETKTAPIFSTVCVGEITSEQRLPDGRFVLMLQGLSRARTIEEDPADPPPYRTARVELLEDRYSSSSVIDRDRRRVELVSVFCKLFPRIDLDHIFQEALASSIPLGAVCDVLAYAMRLAPPECQAVLDELDVDARSELLLAALRRSARRPHGDGPDRGFPPPFSEN